MAERNSKAFFDALDKEKTMTRDAGSTCQCNESADDKLRIGIYREAWKDAEEACRLAKKLADGKSEDNDRLRKENNELRKEIEGLNRCNERQGEKLSELNAQNKDLLEANGIFQAGYVQLEKQLTEANRHKGYAHEEVLELEREIERLKADVDLLRGVSLDRLNQVTKLTEEKERILQFHKLLEARLSRKESALFDIRRIVERA